MYVHLCSASVCVSAVVCLCVPVYSCVCVCTPVCICIYSCVCVHLFLSCICVSLVMYLCVCIYSCIRVSVSLVSVCVPVSSCRGSHCRLLSPRTPCGCVPRAGCLSVTIKLDLGGQLCLASALSALFPTVRGHGSSGMRTHVAEIQHSLGFNILPFSVGCQEQNGLTS